MTRWLPSFAACFLLSAAPVSAQSAAPGLPGLAFMSGCWQGKTASGSTIEEHYTTPSSNLILGTTRYLRDGATRNFEFTMINADSSGSRVTPHPGGRASVSFRESGRTQTSVVWDNASHDFPQRIRYERVGQDSLVATISLIDGSRATGYRMGKVGCP